MDLLVSSLLPTSSLDFENQKVQDFVSEFRTISHQKKVAIQLYNKVRDFALYDPYHLDLRPQALKASHILDKKRAWCVEKAILMAACSRALGIPSQLGFAIVKNHLNIEKLIHYLRKDEIVFHGYVSLYIDGKWVRCTPAFDQKVCRISKVEVLEFDGENDSLFQEFTQDKAFMEYLHYYGEFTDVPLELMNNEMKLHYPHLFEEKYESKEFSFFHC
jgi:transglutaminase-like putative cysteine protease